MSSKLDNKRIKEFIDLYIYEEKSTRQIGKIMHCDWTSVEHCLKRNDIKLRTISEATLGKLKKGGRSSHSNGYIHILQPNHPNCNSKGYIFEHRLVLEKKLGRFLEKNEISHHKNGIRDDNRIENLELMKWGEHTRFHNLCRGIFI